MFVPQDSTAQFHLGTASKAAAVDAYTAHSCARASPHGLGSASVPHCPSTPSFLIQTVGKVTCPPALTRVLGTIGGAGAGSVWTTRSGPSAAVQLGSSHEYSATATLGGVGVPVRLPSGSYTTAGFCTIWYARTRIVASLRSRGAANVQQSIRQWSLLGAGHVSSADESAASPPLAVSVLEPRVNDVFCTSGSPSEGIALRSPPLRSPPLRSPPLRSPPFTSGLVGSLMWPTSAPS